MRLESAASGSSTAPKSKPSSPSPKVFCLEGIGGIFLSLEMDGVRNGGGGGGLSESLGGVDMCTDYDLDCIGMLERWSYGLG